MSYQRLVVKIPLVDPFCPQTLWNYDLNVNLLELTFYLHSYP